MLNRELKINFKAKRIIRIITAHKMHGMAFLLVGDGGALDFNQWKKLI